MADNTCGMKGITAENQAVFVFLSLNAISLDPSLDEAKATVAMTRLDEIWDQLFPAEQARIVRLLVEKVIVSPTELEVRLRANGLEKIVLELQADRLQVMREEVAA